MQMIYKLKKFNLNFVIIAFLAFFLTQNSFSQDFFGKVKIPHAGNQGLIKVKSSTNWFIVMWGGGVMKSTNSGTSWASVNSGLTNLLCTDLSFSTSGDIYVSTFGGGVFKSTNNGTLWTNVSNGITNMNVRSILVYPNGHVFAGTYGGGVFKTTNGGSNWVESNKGLSYRDVVSLAYSSNGFVIAGTYGGGIWKSQDSGKTWNRASTGLKSLFINKILLAPGSSRMFAATNGRGVYESTDGIAWAELDTFYTPAWAGVPSPFPDMNATTVAFSKRSYPVFGTRTWGVYFYDPDVYDTYRLSDLFAQGISDITTTSTGDLLATRPTGKTLISTNSGENWKELGDVPQNLKETRIATLKSNLYFLYDTTAIMKKSVDSGYTWTSTPSLGSRVWSLCLDSNKMIVAGTNSGVYHSFDNGNTWIYRQLKDTAIYSLATLQNGKILAGTQYLKVGSGMPPPVTIDNRLYASTDNGTTWKSVFSSTEQEGYVKFLKVNKKGWIYAALAYALKVSKDNGATWQTAYTFKNTINSIALNSKDYVYVAQQDGIFQSTDGMTFAKCYASAMCEEINITNKDIIYAKTVAADVKTGGFFNNLLKSTDEGFTFKNLGNNFTMEYVVGIESNNDGDLFITTTSGNLYSAIDSSSMRPPTQVTVPDSARNVSINAEFTWSKAPKAELYQFELCDQPEFENRWENITQSNTNYTIERTLSYNTTYYWRVRSKNHSAVSEWSPIFIFSTPLAKPVLRTPANDSMGIFRLADLGWHSVDGAERYKVEVATDAAFTKIVFKADSVNGIDTVTTKLLGLTKYYWRVKAYNKIAESAWSDTWAFTTVIAPPIHISPADQSVGMDIAVNFKWYSAPTATNYEFEISEFKDFSVIIYSGPNTKDTTHFQQALSYQKTYYWHVRAINKDGVSEWSDAWTFTTGLSPVVLIAPLNKAVHLKVDVKLDWQKHTLANDYEILVSKSPDFTDTVLTKTVSNVDDFTYKFANYTTFYWKVRALMGVFKGTWSQVWDFKTSVAPTNLRYPDNSSKDLPTEISFEWFAQPGANKYHLQIANDKEFADLIFSQDTLVSITKLIKDLKINKTYYWRVRAISTEGIGDWSEVWSFTTGNNVPVLLSPANNYTTSLLDILFKWNSVAGALSYNLQVATENTFANPIINIESLPNIEYLAKALTPNKYYWRVSANLIDNQKTTWSQIWGLTITGTDVEEQENNSIVVNTYPNPFSDKLNITVDNFSSSNLRIKILDLSGYAIAELYNGYLPAGKYSFNWIPSNISAGTYFYQIISDKGIITKEIRYIK